MERVDEIHGLPCPDGSGVSGGIVMRAPVPGYSRGGRAGVAPFPCGHNDRETRFCGLSGPWDE